MRFASFSSGHFFPEPYSFRRWSTFGQLSRERDVTREGCQVDNGLSGLSDTCSNRIHSSGKRDASPPRHLQFFSLSPFPLSLHSLVVSCLIYTTQVLCLHRTGSSSQAPSWDLLVRSRARLLALSLTPTIATPGVGL